MDLLITLVLSLIATTITQIAKRTKITDPRLMALVFSLFIAAVYVIIRGMPFAQSFLQESGSIFTIASTIYTLLDKQINKIL